MKTGFSKESLYGNKLSLVSPHPASPSSPHPTPLWIGLRAAKANLIPGMIVQAAMLALGLAYYYYAPAKEGLEQLATLKKEWGYGFAFVSGAIAGGVLPEILTVAVFQRGRVERKNIENLLFGVLYWGSQGIMVDAFYRAQAWMFGSQANFLTIVKKVLVDQFLYTPFNALHLAQATYEWKKAGYRVSGFTHTLTRRFFVQETFPAIVAAWGVWIPLVSIIYSLPSPLQVPFFSLALTFWVMIFTWINYHAARK